MIFKKRISTLDLNELKYPIGKFNKPERITLETIGRWIDEIEHLPHQIRNAVGDLNQQQLRNTLPSWRLDYSTSNPPPSGQSHE